MRYLGQGPQAPAAGVQFVKGTPAATPVLRPLRQPLFDREIYPAAGIRRLDLFVNPTAFNNGTAKDERDTNMTQGGSLGTPLEFDLVGFQLEVNRGATLADYNLFYNNGLFRFVFGASTEWLTLPLTKVPEGTGLFASLDGAGAAVAALANGTPSRNQFVNFTTPDNKARRITSNESFRVITLWPDVPTPANAVTYMVYLLGILYAQL